MAQAYLFVHFREKTTPDSFPVETIAADAEINLFAVRCCFFPKMNK